MITALSNNFEHFREIEPRYRVILKPYKLLKNNTSQFVEIKILTDMESGEIDIQFPAIITLVKRFFSRHMRNVINQCLRLPLYSIKIHSIMNHLSWNSI